MVAKTIVGNVHQKSPHRVRNPKRGSISKDRIKTSEGQPTKRPGNPGHRPCPRKPLGKTQVDNGKNRRPPQKRRRGSKVTEIKEGDKLYVITRRDLDPGYQAVQSLHAMRQFIADHPDVDKNWFENSNYLALLSVKDECELHALISRALKRNFKVSAYKEEDVDFQVTAIAIEPAGSALCKNFPLALKEFNGR